MEAGLAPALGAVLEQLSSGGGAKGVDVAAIQGEIEILSSKLALQIPSYFALILRTFSLIEGIALKVRFKKEEEVFFLPFLPCACFDVFLSQFPPQKY